MSKTRFPDVSWCLQPPGIWEPISEKVNKLNVQSFFKHNNCFMMFQKVFPRIPGGCRHQESARNRVLDKFYRRFCDSFLKQIVFFEKHMFFEHFDVISIFSSVISIISSVISILHIFKYDPKEQAQHLLHFCTSSSSWIDF